MGALAMPTFSTPEPISVTVDMEVGAVRVVASDRADTVVEVRPTDPSNPMDVKAAEQTQTDYASGRLQVRTPKQRSIGLFWKPGSVEVTIELPSGSELDGAAKVGSFRGTGDLGLCKWKTTMGDIHLERTGPAELRTGMGAVTADVLGGRAEVSTGTGEIRLGSVEGSLLIKNSNGSTWIGDVSGDLQVKAANGDITIGRAGGDVGARTANGSVRVAEVARGATTLKTALGEIEVGLSADSAARLDVDTSFGRIRNELDKVASPAGSAETVDVRAHTSAGDIVIRRAAS